MTEKVIKVVRFSVKSNGILNESLRQGKRSICIERFFKSDVTKTSNGEGGGGGAPEPVPVKGLEKR